MGRPKKIFDLAEVEKLGRLHCTFEEMAGFFSCDYDTIANRMHHDDKFSGAYKKGKAAGKISLRRLQLVSAQGTIDEKTFISTVEKYVREFKLWAIKKFKGNSPDIKELENLVTYAKRYKFGSTSMQIWLGKQLLDQKDRPEEQKDANVQPDWVERAIAYSIKDVGFHREVLYGSKLHPPQIEAIKLVERHIVDKTGGVITIRSARQTMKNECSAMIAARALYKHKDIGGVYIRTAPTWKPQIVNSKMRLEKFLRQDPLINNQHKAREGYIFELGNAQVHFLSTDMKANVVGDTASIALDIDEAHKVDKGKYEEDFGPMTAFTNAPTVMWGVAADKQDLLYEYIQHNKEHNPELNLSYPASVWCDLNPRYAKHYEERLSKLGADHPVILTQYDLVDVDSVGGFLTGYQQTIILDSDHHQYSAPKDGREYIALIDIAGEAEEEEQDFLKKSEGARDSTAMLIFEVDWKDIVNEYPMCRLVNIYWWTGKSMGNEPSGLSGQQEELLKLLNIWKPNSTVVDGRGIGAQIAGYLHKRFDGVTVYNATNDTVSEDCFSFLGMVNNQRVKVFRDNQSPEYAEMVKQIKKTGKEISKSMRMKIIKPNPKVHIDIMKAATYLPRAVGCYQVAEIW